jgi:hypothetical protein
MQECAIAVGQKPPIRTITAGFGSNGPSLLTLPDMAVTMGLQIDRINSAEKMAADVIHALPQVSQ